MIIGYQGEPASYSHRAAGELFPGDERSGHPSFAAAFHALRDGDVDRLVLPIENSTTGSILPVLNRVALSGASIVGEHLVDIQHALMAVPGTTMEDIKTVRSHPEALSQAQDGIERHGWTPVPAHDTAGAVRQVAEHQDRSEAALASATAAEEHGLEILAANFVDRAHNTTRFVVLQMGSPPVPEDADKTSIVFFTGHTPGALALALTEIGLRGANLTRIESRPSEEAWKYRFFVDMIHEPGEAGRKDILDPPPATIADMQLLGTYRSARR